MINNTSTKKELTFNGYVYFDYKLISQNRYVCRVYQFYKILALKSAFLVYIARKYL